MRVALRRGLFTTVLGAALAGALIYAFWPRPVPVDLGEVTRGTLRVTVNDEGRTRVKEIYVVSAPLAGRMLRIKSHVGDAVVAEETVLAVIQRSEPTFLDLRSRRQAEATVKAAEAAKALADADLVRAEAELEFAVAELQRAQKLAARQTISQRALERAQLDVKTSRAAVATAKALVRVKDFELETARAVLITPIEEETASRGEQSCCVEVRAPVSGRVLKIIHESESVVAAAEPLIEIGDPRQLEIEVDLLSTDAVTVTEGAEAVIDEWGGDVPLRGRVRRVEPYGFTKISALGIEEQRVNVIIDLIDPPSLWRALGHGYRVEARIVVWQGDDVLKLPVSALFRDGDAWAVFVVSEDRARLRRVTIGRRNAVEAQVQEGIVEGERVVLYPSDRVDDGVRIISRTTE